MKHWVYEKPQKELPDIPYWIIGTSIPLVLSFIYLLICDFTASIIFWLIGLLTFVIWGGIAFSNTPN